MHGLRQVSHPPLAVIAGDSGVRVQPSPFDPVLHRAVRGKEMESSPTLNAQRRLDRTAPADDVVFEAQLDPAGISGWLLRTQEPPVEPSGRGGRRKGGLRGQFCCRGMHVGGIEEESTHPVPPEISVYTAEMTASSREAHP